MLKEVLRKTVITMLDDIPTPAELYVLMLAGSSSEEAVAANLSTVTSLSNTLYYYRNVTVTRDYTGPNHWSVTKVASELREAGLESNEDCGHIQSAEDVKDAIAKFGAAVRGCAWCQNWFVSNRNPEFSFPANCAGCGDVPFPLDVAAVGPVNPRNAEANDPMTYEKHVLRMVRSRVEGVSDLSVKVALVEGTTVNHARRLLAGNETSVETATDGLESCPLAASCHSLCGVLQARGQRAIPLAPFSGRFNDCHNYGFRSMSEHLKEGNAREGIAKKWAEQVFEISRREEPFQVAARAMAEMDAGASVTDEPIVEQKVSVQASLF